MLVPFSVKQANQLHLDAGASCFSHVGPLSLLLRFGMIIFLPAHNISKILFFTIPTLLTSIIKKDNYHPLENVKVASPKYK